MKSDKYLRSVEERSRNIVYDRKTTSFRISWRRVRKPLACRRLNTSWQDEVAILFLGRFQTFTLPTQPTYTPNLTPPPLHHTQSYIYKYIDYSVVQSIPGEQPRVYQGSSLEYTREVVQSILEEQSRVYQGSSRKYTSRVVQIIPGEQPRV